MFCEMFRHLPVCSVIHDKVLVIHGGLFHREGVALADLEEASVSFFRASRNSACPEATTLVSTALRRVRDFSFSSGILTRRGETERFLMSRVGVES